MPSNATIEQSHRRISGTFTLPTPSNKAPLTFIWDGAALTEDGSVVLLEDELTSIVPLHIQGHLARAALMNASGESIVRIVWVVNEDKFEMLWRVVETWREVVRDNLGIETPPCEYQTPNGERLMVSHDFR